MCRQVAAEGFLDVGEDDRVVGAGYAESLVGWDHDAGEAAQVSAVLG